MKLCSIIVSDKSGECMDFVGVADNLPRACEMLFEYTGYNSIKEVRPMHNDDFKVSGLFMCNIPSIGHYRLYYSIDQIELNKVV